MYVPSRNRYDIRRKLALKNQCTLIKTTDKSFSLHLRPTAYDGHDALYNAKEKRGI